MRKPFIAGLFAVYVGLLLFVSWWPFHFRLHGGTVASVEWPLFKLLFPAFWGDGKDNVLKIVTFVPLGVFLATFAKTPVRLTTIVPNAIAGGVTLGLVVQLGWFFIPGRSVSASGLVLNVVGTLAGASPLCFHYLSRRLLGLLTAGYALCFLVAATAPWQFSWQAASLHRLYHRIEWMPFHTRLAMWIIKEDTLNSLITLPLGLLAGSYVLRQSGGRRALIVATWIGFGCSATVEGLQCFLRTRTPSASDITLNTLGALAGGAVAYYLERWHVRHPLAIRQN